MPTILIIDDDKHTRQLLERILLHSPALRRFAPRVVGAGDGREGLEVFSAEKPDLVICDLLMPRMDGFQFCEALRKLPEGKDVGLLVTSGLYRDAAVNARVREEYGGVFFTKPYQIKELAAAVEKLLEARAPSSPSGGAIAPEEMLTVVPEEVAPSAVGAFDGDFATTPLPRLLLDLYEGRATGSLELRRARVEKRIDLVVGHPVAVASNQRQETLGQFLVLKKVITEEQHRQALQRAHDENARFGEALVELGFLTSEQLVRQLTSQARFKITNTLRWKDGVFRYRPDRTLLDQTRGSALDPVAVVFLGLKSTSNVEEATRVCEAVGDVPLAPTARASRVRSAFQRAFGADLLWLLDGPHTVREALALAPDAARVLTAIEALLVTGAMERRPVLRTAPTDAAPATGPLVTFQPAPSPPVGVDSATAFVSSAPPAPSAVSATPPATTIAPSRPGAPPSHAPEREASQDANTLYDLLFADEPSIVGPEPHASSPSIPSALSGASEATGPTAALEPAPAATPAPGFEGITFEPGDGIPVEELAPVESGVVEVPHGVPAPGPALDRRVGEAREKLLAEFLRVQTKNAYDVLGLPRDAGPEAVEAAYRARCAEFSIERFAGLDLGRDYSRIEEVLAAYQRAYRTLLDPSRRADEDRRAGNDATRAATRAFAPELAFKRGEELLGAGDLDSAIAQFRAAVAAAPQVPDYHALLGWALYQRGAPEGVSHLEQALAMDPDHAAAHEFLGRAKRRAGDLEGAASHLERALDGRPPRLEALALLEEIRTAQGELRALERQYRKLIHRTGHADAVLAHRLWRSLGAVYRALGDRDAAWTAYQCALKIAPGDAETRRALEELCADDPARFDDRLELARGRLREAPHDPTPLREIFRAAQAASRFDAAFVAASVLVARGAVASSQDEAADFYRRFRPRFLLRAQRDFHSEAGDDLRARVRHPEDDPALGQLFALLDPFARELSPIRLADLDVSERDHVPFGDLPPAFARVTTYVAGLLGVEPPAVYRRADFADQVHAGAADRTVLLVGPQALASEDRVDLAFRIGRAMTFLWEGRAVAASRPARELRTLLLATLKFASPDVPIDDPDGRLARAAARLAQAPEAAQREIRRLVSVVTTGKASLNLSRWSRALARTAERIGLLLCGDVTVAARALASFAPPDALEELYDWALSADHLKARVMMGISIEV